MSNLLHKVKDVFTGHHHGSGKESSSDANAHDTYNSGDNLGANTNAQDYGGSDYNSRPMAGDNYNEAGYTSGAYQDTRMPPQMQNQMPNQMQNQMPNQMPNQMQNQMPNQMPNQMQNQMPERAPDQMPHRMEGGGNKYEASGLESENRGASLYGPNDQRDPNMLNRGNEAGDAYDQPNMRRDNYDSGGNEDSANKMKYSETGPSNSKKPIHDIYSSNELNSSAYHKIKKDPDNYGATNMGSSSGYDATTRTGDYGSDIGPHLYEPPLGGNGLNDTEADVREPQGTSGASEMGKDSQNQGTYGDPMGQTRSYTSDYGWTGENTSGKTHGYNTRSKNADSSMADQVEARAETEANQRMDQQGFGGSAAGGSSYNAPEPESGAHSSNLLNKLDPRVRSSDFEDNAMGSQRGN